jgi:hypothetical protein
MAYLVAQMSTSLPLASTISGFVQQRRQRIRPLALAVRRLTLRGHQMCVQDLVTSKLSSCMTNADGRLLPSHDDRGQRHHNALTCGNIILCRAVYGSKPTEVTNRAGRSANAHASQIPVAAALIDVKEAERARHRLKGKCAGVPQHEAIRAGEPGR